MTAVILRLIVIVGLFALIAWGVLKIWRDWRGEFKAQDKLRDKLKHERDLRERQRPDVITLQRDKDGKFRPPGDDGSS